MKRTITSISLLVFVLIMVGCVNNNGNSTNEKYTVKFVTNTDLEIPDQIVIKGGKVTKPTDPIKEGYIFTGWYVDDEKCQRERAFCLRFARRFWASFKVSSFFAK